MALQLTDEPGAAEEVLNEAALIAWRDFSSFERSRPFGAWFLKIVTARCSHRSLEPFQTILAQGDALHVVTVIRSLPAECRPAIALYFAADLPYAEIAWVLDLPIEVARAHLHQGRRLLAQRLETAATP